MQFGSLSGLAFSRQCRWPFAELSGLLFGSELAPQSSQSFSPLTGLRFGPPFGEPFIRLSAWPFAPLSSEFPTQLSGPQFAPPFATWFSRLFARQSTWPFGRLFAVLRDSGDTIHRIADRSRLIASAGRGNDARVRLAEERELRVIPCAAQGCHPIAAGGGLAQRCQRCTPWRRKSGSTLPHSKSTGHCGFDFCLSLCLGVEFPVSVF